MAHPSRAAGSFMHKSLITGLLLLSLVSRSHAESTAPPSPEKTYPVQAELVGSLSSANLRIGDRVLAKLKQEWTNGGCTLPRGSALTGHVTSLDLWSRTSKFTRVGLLFDVACATETVQPLTWIALLGPDDSDLAGLHDSNPVARQALRSASFDESNSLKSPTNTQSNHTDLSGRQDPSLPAFLGPAPDRSHPRPTSVSTGQVWGIHDLTLGVSTGPLGSSVLSAPKKNLHLVAGSVLVLSPTHTPATSYSAASTPAAPPSSTFAAATPAALETAVFADLCQPPTCALIPRFGGLLPVSPAQTIPLHTLNYHHLKSAEMRDFEFGAALAYLGPNHLLFTFNPHTLVPRHPTDDPANHPHMVRAVLFNIATATIEAAYDWRVNDDRQYLWPLADDQVLVHSEDRLRILALNSRPTPGPAGSASGVATPPAALEEINSVPLSSSLAFVRTAPDRQHIAVGVLHELHAKDVHKALAEANANGAEEEVSILLLDQALQPIGSSRQSSFAAPPVFSNSGRIHLLHSGGDRWRYAETSWSGSPRTLAHLRSACIPELSSLTADLFFVMGCDVSTTDRWYRVLRSDGSTALKGTLLLHEMPPLPIARISGEAFALALPSARIGYSANSPFHGRDLASEVVRIFRASDGQSLLSIGIHAPSPTRQPLAFAPGGTHIAVLDGEQIVIYPIGGSSPETRATTTPANPRSSPGIATLK